MNTSHTENENPSWDSSKIKVEASPVELATYPLSSSEGSSVSYDDNNDIIEFGPIKVKPRKKPALTLATGRRSKYEVLSPDEEQKRDVRRARNRAAAERVRLSRLSVEQQLQGQINELEAQEQKLSNKVQILHYHKINLEARVLTHEKICPAMTPQNDRMPAFPTYQPPTSTIFQQVEPGSDLNLEDLFVDLPPLLENHQENYSNSLSTLIPDVDPEDLFMNP